MTMLRRIVNKAFVAAVLTCGGFITATAQSAVSCEALADLKLSDSTITAVNRVPAGPFTPPGFTEPITGGDLPAFCRVELTVVPQIRIEVWLPDAWNQRYRAEGGGNYAGSISYVWLGDALRAGYATSSTDTGHPRTVGGTFALNADGSLNHQLIRDFASRSLHEMALKAKQIVKAYYGRAPRYSYWNGCSTGGRQGLTAVQQFPEEYDGVLSKCPAINWDRFVPSNMWPQIVMHQRLGRPIALAKLEAVTKAAVAACDNNDGVKDGIINDPRKCNYDPSASVCGAGSDTNTCLTTEEAEAVRKIWDGPRAQNGERLWFGLERGAPFRVISGPEPQIIGLTHFQYWIKQNPKFDWRTLTEADFEENFKESQRKFNEVLGTDKVNLDRFRKRGGKLIIWHGENDEIVFPRGSIHYFEQVLAANGGHKKVSEYARLFLSPGVSHRCFTGNGEELFPGKLFEALVDWVEKGIAPNEIIASQKLPGGGVRTRPLCAYPKTAKWTGAGSPDEARNYKCVEGDHSKQDFRVAKR